MSELRKEFVQETLQTFLQKNISLVGTLLVIPYFRSKRSGTIFSMLCLNKNETLCDFGFKFSGNDSISSYIKSSLFNGSMGILDYDNEYIMNNSTIVYSLVESVELGNKIIDKLCPPIIFVEKRVEKLGEIANIGLQFKEKFKSSLKGELQSRVCDTCNLVWLKPKDLFYISRSTTYTVLSENGEEITLDINNGGYPAEESVTRIYKANRESGEIPYSINYSDNFNTCFEVNFYQKMSITLRIPLLSYLENLEILV